MIDARYDCVRAHAEKIRLAADALSTAIYEASRDGYRPSIALVNMIAVGDGAFVGNGDVAGVRATIAFDIGGKVAI